MLSLSNSNARLVSSPPSSILRSFPLLHLIENPNKTLPQFPPAIMSWPCSSCTFLNPPSQKSNCQICLTPFSSSSSSSSSLSLSSSSSPPKWACKACTFLNSYSRSNCEICDTRSSLSSLSSFVDLDPIDDSGGSSVGSVFFPLRRCNTATIEDSDGLRDFGAKETFRNGGEREIELGGARNSSSRRKFGDSFSDANTVNGSPRTMKAETIGAEKGPLSVKIAGNAEGNGSVKRKLRDLVDFIEKPFELDRFQAIKSSGNATSLENSIAINGFGREKQATAGDVDKASTSEEIVDDANDKKVSAEIKVLSYNVWFREDLEVHRRMQAIGELIQLHTPDVICFQEVTPNIYSILQKSTWWKRYHCSVSYERAASEAYFCMQLAKLPVKSFSCKPFSYTAMGRELCIAEIEVTKDKSLVIATTHLESPCPGPPTWDQMFSKERVNQAKEAIAFLQKYPNVIFCGDMNWDDKIDGQFPFVEGWFDAWEKLRPSEIGWTYDTKSNKMLTGNRTLQKRLDRFICHLPDFKISCIEMIGTDPIRGLTYSKQKKMKNRIQELTLPVLPSDHYGLLLTLSSTFK